MIRGRRDGVYWAGGALLLGLYVLVAAALLQGKDFGDDGPLSYDRPALTTPLAGGIGLDSVVETCFPDRIEGERVKVVGGMVDGEGYYACYLADSEGSVFDADVLDLGGYRVGDAGLIKRGGAWPWVGAVTSAEGFVYGGAVAVVALALCWAWHRLRRARSEARRRRHTVMLVVVGIALAVTWLYTWAITVVVLRHPDVWGLVGVGVALFALVYGTVAGSVLLQRREALEWLSLTPRLGELAAALFAFVVVLPVIVAVLLFMSALGGLLFSHTAWHGHVLLGAAIAFALFVGVVVRWARARRRLATAERPSAVLAVAVCAAALVAVTAVTVPIYGAVDWFGLEIDEGASAFDEPSAQTSSETDDPSSDYTAREAGVLVAARLVHPDEIVDVDCVEPDLNGDAACTVVFDGFVCQAWLSTGKTPGPYRAHSTEDPVQYQRVWFDGETGRWTCS